VQLNLERAGYTLSGLKPSALDLRQNIFRAYDQQLGSQRALATLFGVSHACLEQLRRRRTTGEIAPHPHAGGRQPRGAPAALALGRQWGHAQPDATRGKLWVQLQQPRGLRVSLATMGRLLPRLGLPRKKRRALPLSASPRVSSTPARPLASGSPGSISGRCSVWRNRGCTWR
jgi:transposase